MTVARAEASTIIMDSNGIPWQKIQEKPDKEHKVPGRSLLAFRNELDAQKNMISSLKTEIEKMKADSSQNVNALQHDNEIIRENVNACEKEIREQRAAISRLEEDNSSLRKEIEIIEANKSKIEATLNQDLQKEKNAAIELKAELEKARDALQSVSAILSGAQAEKTTMEASLKGEIEKRQQVAENVQAQLEGVLESKQRELDALEADLAKERENVDKLADKILELEDELKPKEIMPKAEADLDLTAVRACMTCKHYVLVKDGDYKYVLAMQSFDTHHRGHMLGTLTYGEVKNTFSSKTAEFLEKVAKSGR